MDFQVCRPQNYRVPCHLNLNVKPHVHTTHSHKILLTTHGYLTLAFSLINADGWYAQKGSGKWLVRTITPLIATSTSGTDTILIFSAASEKEKLDREELAITVHYNQVTYSEPSSSIHAHGLDLFLPRSPSQIILNSLVPRLLPDFAVEKNLDFFSTAAR